MARFEPSDYSALNLSGYNYLEWVKNTLVALRSRGLGQCINEYNDIIDSERHRAITIIRYHLTEELRDLYLHVEDPCDLWLQLRKGSNRYRGKRPTMNGRSSDSRILNPWTNIILL